MTRKINNSPLVMNSRTKKAIFGLIKEWEGMRERLMKIAERQAKQRDYRDAADNSMMAHGIGGCIEDLQKLISGNYPNWTY